MHPEWLYKSQSHTDKNAHKFNIQTRASATVSMIMNELMHQIQKQHRIIREQKITLHRISQKPHARARKYFYDSTRTRRQV